jgi:hypothetical protein
MHIVLAVDTSAGTNSPAQSYRIRVEHENGHRTLSVIRADTAGVLYGGLDVAEAIRTGTLDSLKDSDHTPHIAQRGTMPGTSVLNIIEWRNGVLAQKQADGVTPQEIASVLHSSASGALAALPELRRATVTPAASAKEYAATLGDIEAMSHLGLYYAAKIRGACDLALFDKTGDVKQQASALQHLEVALNYWKNYSASYTRQYVQPVLYNRAGLVDIPRQTQDVAADVQTARDWKPGTIDEAQIKRSGTEKGFRK